MSAIWVTKREITVKAVLDIIDPEQRKKLDTIMRLVQELEEDDAIYADARDVDRQTSHKALPRQPEKIRMVAGAKAPPPASPPKKPRQRSGRALAKSYYEILSCFEGDEWIGLKELTTMLKKAPATVRASMEKLKQEGLVLEQPKANDTTFHYEPHYQLVSSKAEELAKASGVRNLASAAPAAALESDDDLGLDLLDLDVSPDAGIDVEGDMNDLMDEEE